MSKHGAFHEQWRNGEEFAGANSQPEYPLPNAPANIVIDLEGQMKSVKGSRDSIAAEYSIATSTKYLYLSLYFALNLALTIYNKAVLGRVCQRSNLGIFLGGVRMLMSAHHSSLSHGYSQLYTPEQRLWAVTSCC